MAGRGRPRKDSTGSVGSSSENKSTFSPYALFNAWVRDGRTDSPLPKELQENCPITQMFILYYFVTNPKIFIWINKNFNNYDLLVLPQIDIFKIIKQIVQKTGIKQSYVPKFKKEKNQLCDILKKRFPYYKPEEISMAVDIIDDNEELQSTVYENFDIRVPKKTKTKKNEFNEKMTAILSKESMLNDL